MPHSHKDKRKFDASFSVKVNTKRTRVELSEATLYGGPEGTCRVRIDRRWYDSPEGEALFLTRGQIASLLVDMSLNALAPLPPCPEDFRKYTRCSVTFPHKGQDISTQCIVMSPPLRGFDGRYYVFVQAGSYGRLFAPTDNITVRVV